jgi:hypothetical protein
MLVLPHQFCLFKSKLLNTRIKNEMKNINEKNTQSTKHKKN